MKLTDPKAPCYQRLANAIACLTASHTVLARNVHMNDETGICTPTSSAERTAPGNEGI
jgi:hypothetical protein